MTDKIYTLKHSTAVGLDLELFTKAREEMMAIACMTDKELGQDDEIHVTRFRPAQFLVY